MCILSFPGHYIVQLQEKYGILAVAVVSIMFLKLMISNIMLSRKFASIKWSDASLQKRKINEL